MVYLNDEDKKKWVKDLMESENSVWVLKYYQDRFEDLVKLIEKTPFKDTTSIILDIFRHETALTIIFEDLSKDINSVELMKFHRGLSNFTFPCRVEIEDKSNISYDYDGCAEEEVYVMAEGFDYGQVDEDISLSEINTFFKEYDELYDKIVPTSLNTKTYQANLELNATFKGNKVDKIYYDYGFGYDEIVEGEVVFSDRNLATDTYEHYLFSKYFSKYIKVINNLWFLTDRLGKEMGLDFTEVKGLVAKDIAKTKEYMEEVLKPVKSSDSLYGIKYELEMYKGLNLNVIISGYDLDMNFFNSKDNFKSIDNLGLKYINVNLIINNDSLLPHLVSLKDSGIRRIDTIYKVEGNAVVSAYLSHIYEGLKSKYGISHFNPSSGNGRVLIDMTSVGLSNSSLQWIPLTWANEFGLYENKGNVGDIKFLVYVESNRADSVLDKDSVNFNAVVESYWTILDSIRG